MSEQRKLSGRANQQAMPWRAFNVPEGLARTTMTDAWDEQQNELAEREVLGLEEDLRRERAAHGWTPHYSQLLRKLDKLRQKMIRNGRLTMPWQETRPT